VWREGGENCAPHKKEGRGGKTLCLAVLEGEKRRKGGRGGSDLEEKERKKEEAVKDIELSYSACAIDERRKKEGISAVSPKKQEKGSFPGATAPPMLREALRKLKKEKGLRPRD